MNSNTNDDGEFDYVVKLLLIGDSGVGKSSLLSRFCGSEDQAWEDLAPTIGVDFKLKFVKAKGATLKLTIWDTAGQERFRTLTSSYYRGAQGIIYVYDVTKRETFEAIEEVWQKEVEMYSTVRDAVKIVVGNKIDLANEQREVSKSRALEFAKREGCLFLECSSKTKVSVKELFDELLAAIVDTPSLLRNTSSRREGVHLKDVRGDGNFVTRNCC